MLENPKKIVYLFGAGATHAELANLEHDPMAEKFSKSRGLLMGDVSRRVMEIASKNKEYLKDISMVSSAGRALNIELFISLIENSKICNYQKKTTYLKNLVERDIRGKLTQYKKNRFYLHKALLEFHNNTFIQQRELVIGFMTLNYDDILDEAYREIYKTKLPNYCLYPRANSNPPLLKLHGSFSWKNIKINGRRRNIQIIPLGSGKSYVHAPYNFIWNKALEILIECDVLRVIGSSLSQNDFHLVDLLFKAHLEKGDSFDIEFINSDDGGKNIRKNFGFFTKIKTLSEIENFLIPDPDPVNPFKKWLSYKIRKEFNTMPIPSKLIKKVLI